MRNKLMLAACLCLFSTMALAQAAVDPAAAVSLPPAAKAAIDARFPGTEVGLVAVGELHQAGALDIAVMLAGAEDPHGRLIAVLWREADGRYRVANASPWLDPGGGNYDFDLTLERRSIFIHTSYPGRDVAESDRYQFSYRNGKLRLIGFTMDLLGHGEENSAFHYVNEINFMTGDKRDIREDDVGGKAKQRTVQTRIPVRMPVVLEDFAFGAGFTDAELCKRIGPDFKLTACDPS